MANIIEYLKRIKLVYRRRSNRMKIFVIAVIVLGIAGLFSLHCALSDLNAENRALENQITALEQKNEDLADKIRIQGTKEAVIQIARELLGLVTPDTVIVQPQG